MSVVGETTSGLRRLLMHPLSLVGFTIVGYYVAHLLFQTVNPLVALKSLIMGDLSSAADGTVEKTLLTFALNGVNLIIQHEARFLAMIFILIPLFVDYSNLNIVTSIILALIVLSSATLSIGTVVVLGSFYDIFCFTNTPSSRLYVMVLFFSFLFCI